MVAQAKAGRQGCPGGRGKAALVARSQGKSQGRAPGLPLGPRQGAVWPRDRVVVLLRVAARVAWSRSRELGIARTGVARSGIASSGVEIRRHESRRERRPEPFTDGAVGVSTSDIVSLGFGWFAGVSTSDIASLGFGRFGASAQVISFHLASAVRGRQHK